MFELFPAWRRDLLCVHCAGKSLDSVVGLYDIASQLLIRHECGMAQPVMADHALFVRVRDRARFQFAHCGEGFVDLRPHFFKKTIREFHPADVDRKLRLLVTQKILLEALPERRGCHQSYYTGGTTSVSSH